jgi:hypothetical protein
VTFELHGRQAPYILSQSRGENRLPASTGGAQVTGALTEEGAGEKPLEREQKHRSNFIPGKRAKQESPV